MSQGVVKSAMGITAGLACVLYQMRMRMQDTPIRRSICCCAGCLLSCLGAAGAVLTTALIGHLRMPGAAVPIRTTPDPYWAV